MNKSLSLLSLILAIGFIPAKTVGQQKLNAKIEWPREIAAGKIKIFLDNGMEEKQLLLKPGLHSVEVKDSFFSLYAGLRILLDSSQPYFPAHALFYISAKPALISLVFPKNNVAKSWQQFKLHNALNATEAEDKFEDFIRKDQQALTDYANSKNLDSVYFSLFAGLIRKKLAFIKANDSSYFSFQLFKTQIAPLSIGDPDPLYDSFQDFYESNFPARWRQTPEGKKVAATILNRRLAFRNNFPAPEFQVTDIQGKKINSRSLRGKYVLLNLWATWCAPCMAKLPALQQIRGAFPSSQLEMISVSYDRDSTAFTKARIKYNMNWWNVFYDRVLAEKYGGLSFLPKLFLIDPAGKVIYNENAAMEADLVNLVSLKALLQQKIPQNAGVK